MEETCPYLNVDMVEFLLTLSIDRNQTDALGFTPLLSIYSEGNPQKIKLISQTDASPLSVAKDGTCIKTILLR